MEKVLRLDPPTWALLQEYAEADDVSVGQVIRSAIAREIRRRRQAKTAVRPDEQLVAPLRALLADDFSYSVTWADLQTRLAHKGYVLAEAGGGLILQDVKTSARLCKGSDLGHGYAALMRKFNAPFPGHAHDWLFDRVKQDQARQPDRPSSSRLASIGDGSARRQG